jgi:hypothetical protein
MPGMLIYSSNGVRSVAIVFVGREMRTILVTTLLILLSVQDAAAKIITQCSASDGYAYYFEGGLVPPSEGGWRKDGTGGGFQFISADDGSDPDIVFSDSIGTRSSRADGAQVLRVPGGDEGFYLVLSIYPPGGRRPS